MATQKVNPFFRVKKEPIQTASGIIIPNRFALVNQKTGSLLGIMSNEYEVILNSKVAELFDSALQDYKVLRTIDNIDALQRRWKRRIIFENLTAPVVEGDIINVMLEIFNGYDVRSGFGYELMAFRSLCENGLIFGKRSLFRESYYHFVDNPRKLQLSIEAKMNGVRGNVEQWTRWTTEDYDKEKFSRFVQGRKYLTVQMKEKIVDAYDPITNKFGAKHTKWNAFNVITYLCSHETKARQGSNVFSNRYRIFDKLAEDFYQEAK
jgi:hypothetical protein